MYKEKIVNHTTGEETWRDYTSEEIKAVEIAQKETNQRIEAELEKEKIRQSALSKLIDLGLTEEEIAAL